MINEKNIADKCETILRREKKSNLLTKITTALDNPPFITFIMPQSINLKVKMSLRVNIHKLAPEKLCYFFLGFTLSM